jgi:hypothetical protein
MTLGWFARGEKKGREEGQLGSGSFGWWACGPRGMLGLENRFEFEWLFQIQISLKRIKQFRKSNSSEMQ